MLGLPFFLSLVGVSVTTLFLFILSQCTLASSSMWLSKGGGLPEMEVRKSLRKSGFSTGTPRMARPEKSTFRDNDLRRKKDKEREK